jgi:CheY-like chemotaxis protein
MFGAASPSRALGIRADAAQRIAAGLEFSGGHGRRPDSSAAMGSDGAVAMAPRILIVEDEALIAWNLQSLVEGLGYAVCGTASTGVRAIGLADSEKPDLILMDVRLADRISGIEAAERILAERWVPIIFVTAFTDRATAERIDALGAQRLSKPVMPHMLAGLLERLLRPDSSH